MMRAPHRLLMSFDRAQGEKDSQQKWVVPFHFVELSVTATRVIPPLRSTHSTRTVVLLLQQRLRVVVSYSCRKIPRNRIWRTKRRYLVFENDRLQQFHLEFHPRGVVIKRRLDHSSRLYLSIDFRKNRCDPSRLSFILVVALEFK